MISAAICYTFTDLQRLWIFFFIMTEYLVGSRHRFHIISKVFMMWEHLVLMQLRSPLRLHFNDHITVNISVRIIIAIYNYFCIRKHPWSQRLSAILSLTCNVFGSFFFIMTEYLVGSRHRFHIISKVFMMWEHLVLMQLRSPLRLHFNDHITVNITVRIIIAIYNYFMFQLQHSKYF